MQALASSRPVTFPASAGALTVALLVGVGYFPLLAEFVGQAWASPHVELYLVVLGGATWLAARVMRHPVPAAERDDRLRGYALAACSFVVLTLAALFDSPNLGVLALVLTLAAAGFTLGGTALLKRLLPALLVLGLAVPLQMGLYHQLAVTLQTLTAQWSSRVLDLFGFYHVLAGNVLEFGGQRFLVEEGCSGIHSLSAIFAGTLFLAVYLERPWWHAGLLLGGAALAALAVNVVRVTAVVLLGTEFGWDVTQVGPHEAVGVVATLVALLLVASLDQLLTFFLEPADPDLVIAFELTYPLRAGLVGPPLALKPLPGGLRPVAQAELGNGKATADAALAGTEARGAPGWWSAALAFGLLGGFQIVFCWRQPDDAAPAAADTAARLADLGEDRLPAEQGPWHRLDFQVLRRERGNRYGEFSRVWQYQWGQRRGAVSLDYAFSNWHDLCDCYQNQGWLRDERTVHRGPEDNDAGDYFVRVAFRRPPAQHGLLFFSIVDDEGRPVPDPGVIGYLERFALRWQGLRAGQFRWRGGAEPLGTRGSWVGSLYQVQLFVEGFDPPTPAEEAEARDFFLRAREQLCGAWSFVSSQ